MDTSTRPAEFEPGRYIAYPGHGVGRVVSIEKLGIFDTAIEVYVISFEKDKMTLYVPVATAWSTNMRHLSDPNIVKKAFQKLKGRPRVKRAMWSRRAEEHEQKINSGILIKVAEVVRDLYRLGGDLDSPRSYSETKIYEKALTRFAREIAAVECTGESAAVSKIRAVLKKARREQLEKTSRDPHSSLDQKRP